MPNAITKAAALIQPAEDDADHPNGAFDVILSAESLDRDGDTLKRDEWKQPLPDHIVFDIDHGMNVATTVGSGKPFIDEDGNLRVKGTYSSIPRGQEIRTLVNEGHIRTTSVAFLTEKSTKDAKPARELLNGAFVAIPSNRDALVLSSKALDVEPELKLGARNNANDAKHIQAAHDHMVMLGAQCQGGPEDSSGADADAEGGKELAADAATTKAAGDDDPGSLASATDAALDQAIELLASVDTSNLPEEVQQAIALILAADSSVDELLDAMDVPDPDEDSTEETDSDAAEKSAASDSVDSADVVARAKQFAIECEALTLSDDE